MYEIGTEVIYNGSLAAQHGLRFTVARQCCGGARHTLLGDVILRHVQTASIAPAIAADVERAISERHPIEIVYIAADGERTERIIEPYEIAMTRRHDHVVRALDHLRSGEPRSFRLDRILALAIMPGSFTLDHSATEQRAALDRIRAEIAQISPAGYGEDAARWTPGDPILH